MNPDQRMHEDARHLSELSADLGIGLLQASILLITFISVLWALSTDFVFHIADRHFTVPGYNGVGGDRLCRIGLAALVLGGCAAPRKARDHRARARPAQMQLGSARAAHGTVVAPLLVLVRTNKCN